MRPGSLFIYILLLTVAGTSVAGEIVVLECPCCGRVSGDLFLGTGKSMSWTRGATWEPSEERIVGMGMHLQSMFEDERGIELEPSFMSGGGDRYELWEEYLAFAQGTLWPDTIRFPEDMDFFDPDLPEYSTETIFLVMREPFACPVCGTEMIVNITGNWD